MQLEVQPTDLQRAAVRLAADAAALDALIVVARLESVAAAAPDTQLATAALAVAGDLRAALFRCRLQLAAYGSRLDGAAESYSAADAQPFVGGAS